MIGSDFLQLDAAQAPQGKRTDWLADRIRCAILDGTLPAGTRLPPTRTLAAELRFARGTVIEAYRRLTEEALTVARPGSGTAVADRLSTPVRAVPGARTGRRDAADARDGLIDLAAGLPDLSAFPRAAWLRAEKDVLATATARQLGYAPPEGTIELRTALSAWLARSRGVVAPPERLIVTAGVTGALSLLAQVLRADGEDAIAIEDPSADGTARILRYWTPHVTAVPVDAEGIQVEPLAATGARTVLVTPAHQYPTGVVLSPRRRRALIEWARRGDGLIVEDDYDAEYRYDRRPVRAMQPLAPERIAYTASLSKTLAPALRLGWLVPPARLHRRLVELRWAIDLGSPALPQLILARLLDSGLLERHLRSMRVRHRTRRDAAVAALARRLPHLEVLGIAAGLHLVLRLPDAIDDRAVAEAARSEGVLVHPLSRYYADGGASGLVISYAANSSARMAAAVDILARIMPKR